MTLVRRAVLLLAGLVAAGAAAVPMSAVAAQAPTSVTVTTPSGDVRLIADRLEEIGADDLVIATGNVEVTRGTQRLTADRVELNRATGDVVAEGRAVFYDGDDRLFGERIEYNYRTGTGVVHDGPARAAPPGRQQRVDPGPAAHVEHELAGPQLGVADGMPHAQRQVHGRLGQPL